MTSVEKDIVPKLRRAIGDTEEPYAYLDTALAEYIEDAIDKVYLDWQHDFIVNRETHVVEPDISDPIQILFVMQAKLDMLERNPSMSYRIGPLNVTRKSDNKKEIAKKIDTVLNRILALDALAVTNTEFDDYAGRLEDWLYISNL